MTRRVRNWQRVLLLVGIVGAAGTARAQPPEAATFSMEEEPFGAYGRAVKVRYFVKAPPREVFEVVTNYERHPEFMPNVEKVTVLERRSDWVKIKWNYRILNFFTYELVGDRNLEPFSRISWDNSSGPGRRSVGSMTLMARGNGTEVHYQIKADPGFPVPSAIVSYILKQGVPEAIHSIIRRAESGGKWCR